MSIIDWLVGVHEEDMAVKALRRIKNGYPIPGDTQRAAKHFGPAFGDLVTKPEKKKR
jgi:hypothetical protein